MSENPGQGEEGKPGHASVGQEGGKGGEGGRGGEGQPVGAGGGGGEGGRGAAGEQGPRGKDGTDNPRNKRWRQFLTTWIILFSLAVGYSIRENRQRVDDIQEARVASCRQTYEGIRKVFKPLFPPPPRTKQVQGRLDTFNDTVDRLKNGCGRQTKVSP